MKKRIQAYHIRADVPHLASRPVDSIYVPEFLLAGHFIDTSEGNEHKGILNPYPRWNHFMNAKGVVEKHSGSVGRIVRPTMLEEKVVEKIYLVERRGPLEVKLKQRFNGSTQSLVRILGGDYLDLDFIDRAILKVSKYIRRPDPVPAW